MKPMDILVLFGGCSTEYGVSLESAHAVLSHMDPEKYYPIPVGITREGAWYWYPGPLEAIPQDRWRENPACVPCTLRLDRGGAALLLLDGSGRTLAFDGAFPLIHGSNGEDGTLQGLFELADGGTLFLDEINSMPVQLQSKLLRVLQDGRFRSLGGQRTKSVDVKVIAAINVDPLQAVRSGQLRQDIYYRLSMMSIRIPPLRERRADIRPFIDLYVNKHNATFHKHIRYISRELAEWMEAYDWPGNVRELEHRIVSAMSRVAPSSQVLGLEDLEELPESGAQPPLPLAEEGARPESPPPLRPLRQAVREYERGLIQRALEAADGNVSRAAQLLEIPRQTLCRRIQGYGLRSGGRRSS